jgi:hypothetical protein
LLIGGCLAAALLLPAGAAGQSSSDPEATSPSGTIYQIPLDTARGEAAPRHAPSGDGGGGGGSGSAQGGSNYRSENNFGSSSEVPGAPGEDGSASGQRSSDNSSGEGKSRELANSSSPSGGLPNATSDPADSGGPSAGGIVLLLVLLFAVALATVTLAIKARRRSP